MGETKEGGLWMPVKRYQTKSRRALETFFAAHPHTCFTARDVIAEPTLDLSAPSVYRLLAVMTEEGFLERIAAQDGEGAAYRFHGGHHREGHFHLKCERCGETLCADCDFVEEMEEHFAKEHGFSISPRNTVLYGTCQKCREKEK